MLNTLLCGIAAIVDDLHTWVVVQIAQFAHPQTKIKVLEVEKEVSVEPFAPL